MMLKIVIASVLLVAAASATSFRSWENDIKNSNYLSNQIYNPVRVPVKIGRAVSLPYSYQEVKNEEESILKPVYGYDVIVPSPAKAKEAKLAIVSKFELLATVVSFGLSIIKKAVSFVIFSTPALILGSVVALGLCKFTPVCSKLDKFSSIFDVKNELAAFATPERLVGVADLVQNAVRKYKALQN